ncbi:MAG: glucose 1-dehydrogenase [Thermaerobacter sp.]|nr:glucose 1-dehydrogenase [Thermaerobacter sp.]
MEAQTCRGIAVTPGKANSARIQSVPVDELGAGELMLRVLEVGICGTDEEINEGLYGAPPTGMDYLVPGHESLTEVVGVGSGLTGWQPGDLAVPIVRRPCPENCAACARGRWDMCLTGDYRERGISGLQGMLRERMTDHADFVVRVPKTLRDCAVLVEPLSIVEKAIGETLRLQRRSPVPPRSALVTGAGPIGLLATLLLRSRGMEVHLLDRRPKESLKARIATAAGANYIDDSTTTLEDATKGLTFDLAIEASGYAPLLFRALGKLGRNAALVLTGVTAGHHSLSIDVDLMNQELVLENQLLVGSVNAARYHYTAAVADLSRWKKRFPGLLPQLITGRYPLERFTDALQKSPDGIKPVVEVSQA